MYLGGGCFGHISFDTLFGYNWDSVFNKKKRKRVVNKLFLKNEKKNTRWYCKVRYVFVHVKIKIGT